MGEPSAHIDGPTGKRQGLNGPIHIGVPAGINRFITAQMGQVRPCQRAHRAEFPADIPTAGPIGYHGEDVAIHFGPGPVGDGGSNAKRGPAADVGAEIIEIAAQIDQAIGLHNGANRSVRDPEIFTSDARRLVG